MSTQTLLLIALVALVAFVAVYYNRLVALRNQHLNALSQIDVQLQRRHELIPNLVETARAYMSHESETLQAVTEARNTAESRRQDAAAEPGSASALGALASAEGVLGSAMGRLNVVMEAYPELKADERLRDLHEELAHTENRVGFSRQAYSDAIMRYNTEREQFPAVLIAGMLRFKEGAPFELEDQSMRHKVDVSFA